MHIFKIISYKKNILLSCYTFIQTFLEINPSNSLTHRDFNATRSRRCGCICCLRQHCRSIKRSVVNVRLCVRIASIHQRTATAYTPIDKIAMLSSLGLPREEAAVNLRARSLLLLAITVLKLTEGLSRKRNVNDVPRC